MIIISAFKNPNTSGACESAARQITGVCSFTDKSRESGPLLKESLGPLKKLTSLVKHGFSSNRSKSFNIMTPKEIRDAAFVEANRVFEENNKELCRKYEEATTIFHQTGSYEDAKILGKLSDEMNHGNVARDRNLVFAEARAVYTSTRTD